MKLQLEAHNFKYVVETQTDDLTAVEFLEIIKGLMYQMTFAEYTINEAILELADEIKQDA
jgi:hypothetical protein